MIERRRLRRIFVAAFESEGLGFEAGGCQVAHTDITWSMSLVVDGTGMGAPYRLVLGASLSELANEAPRNAEDCYMVWPLQYESDDTLDGVPYMPDAVFPEWPGKEDSRSAAIAECVVAAVRYVRQVDSLAALRARHALGHYENALIVAPLRRLMEES